MPGSWQHTVVFFFFSGEGREKAGGPERKTGYGLPRITAELGFVDDR